MVDRRKFRITTLEEYEAVFSAYSHCTALVDSSPSYLMYPEPSIAGIRKYVPEAKFIAIFRHPIDRGYSEYVMQVALGQEPIRRYADAIDAERAGHLRDTGQWRQYFRRGFYTAPTRKFLAAFPRGQFLFLLYDDLVRDPAGLIRSVFQFLEVDPEFIPNMEKRRKVGQWPKHFGIHSLLNSKRGPVRWMERIMPRGLFMKIIRRVNARNLWQTAPLGSGAAPGIGRPVPGGYSRTPGVDRQGSFGLVGGMTMALPNAVILGVAKAGTTTLYHALGAHPQVAVSRIREPKFLFYAGHLRQPAAGKFNQLTIRTLAQYESLYSAKHGVPVRVDISPIYFNFPDQTILGIRQYVPDAMLLIVYRQPVDRAYSAFVMHVREGQEPIRDFAGAMKDGTIRRRRNYLEGSMYAQRTRKFLAAFPRDQLHFLLFDDLLSAPKQFMRSVFGILGVAEDAASAAPARENPGSWPKNDFFDRLLALRLRLPKSFRRLLPAPARRRVLSAVRSMGYEAPPLIDRGLRSELTGLFRADILELQDLIGRDLSAWLAED